MSTGISGPEFVVLLLVAAFVLGPSRVQQLTRQLAQLIKGLRVMARQASVQARREMGPEFDDVDWRSLDPRQYDPRRIIREALSDTVDPDDPFGVRSVRDEVTDAWKTGVAATDVGNGDAGAAGGAELKTETWQADLKNDSEHNDSDATRNDSGVGSSTKHIQDSEKTHTDSGDVTKPTAAAKPKKHTSQANSTKN